MKFQDKVDLIHSTILSVVHTYKNDMVGKYFLYVFDGKYFEMFYGTRNFLHLTGVGSRLSAEQFYMAAKDGTLQKSQLFFNYQYPISIAMKKTKNLYYLNQFIYSELFVYTDIVTSTASYDYGISDIDRFIMMGLAPNTSNIYNPYSLRIGGNVSNISVGMYEVNYILSKSDYIGLYDSICFGDGNQIKKLPDSILSLIDPKLTGRFDLFGGESSNLDINSAPCYPQYKKED